MKKRMFIIIGLLVFAVIAGSLISLIGYNLKKIKNGDMGKSESIVSNIEDFNTEDFDSKESMEDRTKDIPKDISKAGKFAWSWFWDNTHVDNSDTIEAEYQGGGNWTYEAVNEKRITSKEDIFNLTRHYFSKDVTNELMEYKEWIEKGNKLYVSATEGIGGILIDHYNIKIKKNSDTKYTLIVYEYMIDGSSNQPYTVQYYYDNGYWIFNHMFTESSEIPVNIIDDTESTITEPETTESTTAESETAAPTTTVPTTAATVYGEINADLYSVPQRDLYYDDTTPVMRGEDVMYVQAALIEMDYSGITFNGVFDVETQAAVFRFQQRHDLYVDGIVGKHTRSAIQSALIEWRKDHAR